MTHHSGGAEKLHEHFRSFTVLVDDEKKDLGRRTKNKVSLPETVLQEDVCIAPKIDEPVR